jgi:dienelactone hydrolase
MKQFNLIKWFLSVFIFLLSANCFAQAKQNYWAVGQWKGLLTEEKEQLQVILKISKSKEGNLNVTIDVPKQGAIGMPVTKAETVGDSLFIDVDEIGGVYKGYFASPKRLIGTWYQFETKYVLNFSKLSNADTSYVSQVPVKPYPYIEEEVKFPNQQAGIKLVGTLTMPEKGGNFPAVLLISGIGDQDRDLGIYGHKPFLVIADYLTRNGFAVLRFDDRNIDVPEAKKVIPTLEESASDVLAAIDFLKNNPKIDSGKIGLIGIGDGGTMASLAANESGNSAFVVLWGSPGVTGDKALTLQNNLLSKLSGYDQEYVDKNQIIQKVVFDILLNEPSPSRTVERLRLAFSDSTYARMKPDGRAKINEKVQSVNNEWFKFYLKYDPTITYKKLNCPVLAVTGEKDLEFPPIPNLDMIKKALQESGNNKSKIIQLKSLNHILQTCDTGSPDEYIEIKETISPKALKLMGDWIKSKVK